MKIKLNSSQRQLLETIAENANHKYYYFPKIFKKIDGTDEFEELTLEELPAGIKTHILSKGFGK